MVVLEINVFSQLDEIKHHFYSWLADNRNINLLRIFGPLAFVCNGKPLPENEMVGNFGYGSEKIIICVKQSFSQAHEPLNNLYILLRNVEECTNSASAGGNPR